MVKFYNKLSKPYRKNFSRSKYGISQVQALRAERGVGSVRQIKRLAIVPSYTIGGSSDSYSPAENSIK